MSIEASIYSYLTSQASITNLVSTRVYPVALPENPTLPAIRYTLISSPHEHNLEGLSLKRARVQFDCWSEDHSETIDIAAALLSLLDTFQGTMGTVDVVYCTVENEFDFAEPPSGGETNWTYRKTSDFIFRYRS